jgi:SAM-dependent methyltransferase
MVDSLVGRAKRRLRAAGGGTDPAPRRLPLNSLTNVDAYADPTWLASFHDLGTYSNDKHIFSSFEPPQVHRKGWEWTQTVWGLEQLGMIQPGHRAIGVGAGRECVIFWLGDRLRNVVATDLYGNEMWSTVGGREADPTVLVDAQPFCPRPIRQEAIEFKTMDGTDLHYGDGTFDIAWSLSSIEHFGTHERSADAVREMARVVRPGGVVVIATEYLLLADQEHDEYFSHEHFERYVLGATPDLELIEPVDWSRPPVDYLIDTIAFSTFPERLRRHVVLNDGHVQWTSVLAFFTRR